MNENKPSSLLPVLVGFLSCVSLLLVAVTSWSVWKQNRLQDEVDGLSHSFYIDGQKSEELRKMALNALTVEKNAREAWGTFEDRSNREGRIDRNLESLALALRAKGIDWNPKTFKELDAAQR